MDTINKQKKVGILCLIVLLIILVLSSDVNKANAGNLRISNLLLNGDFENGDYLPINWIPDSWTNGADFIWDNSQSYQGNRSIKISSATTNDARWVQEVAVQPNTDYRLSGWIKTENVAHTSEQVDAGANLSLFNTYDHTEGLFGTNGWTKVSMTFNTGSNSHVAIAARLGYWYGTTTGTAWFDNLILEPVNPPPSLPYSIFLPIVYRQTCATTNPSWKILVLVYETTDFSFTDSEGQYHHFIANLSQVEKNRIGYVVNRFVNEDVPALNNCHMLPTVTIRYPSHTLSTLSTMGCNDFAPSPSDVAIDRDPTFDSVISIWDGSGTDQVTGGDMSIQGCAWAWGMGTGQTYNAIYADSVHETERNVFKHEWGHSILFYFDAAGTAPKPPVDNHINNTTNQYVNCTTGESYILQDETDIAPIPNSIYNNYSGFTHDYYSGMTAAVNQPSHCLGVTSSAWASGGPVSGPLLNKVDTERHWHSPADDIISIIVPYRLKESVLGKNNHQD